MPVTDWQTINTQPLQLRPIPIEGGCEAHGMSFCTKCDDHPQYEPLEQPEVYGTIRVRTDFGSQQTILRIMAQRDAGIRPEPAQSPHPMYEAERTQWKVSSPLEDAEDAIVPQVEAGLSLPDLIAHYGHEEGVRRYTAPKVQEPKKLTTEALTTEQRIAQVLARLDELGA